MKLLSVLVLAQLLGQAVAQVPVPNGMFVPIGRINNGNFRDFQTTFQVPVGESVFCGIDGDGRCFGIARLGH